MQVTLDMSDAMEALTVVRAAIRIDGRQHRGSRVGGVMGKARAKW